IGPIYWLWRTQALGLNATEMPMVGARGPCGPLGPLGGGARSPAVDPPATPAPPKAPGGKGTRPSGLGKMSPSPAAATLSFHQPWQADTETGPKTSEG